MGKEECGTTKLYQIHIRIKPDKKTSYYEHINVFINSTIEPILTISECSIEVKHIENTYKELKGKIIGD